MVSRENGAIARMLGSFEEDRKLRERAFAEEWSRMSNRQKAEAFLKNTTTQDIITEASLPRLAAAQVYATLALVDATERKG